MLLDKKYVYYLSLHTPLLFKKYTFILDRDLEIF